MNGIEQLEQFANISLRDGLHCRVLAFRIAIMIKKILCAIDETDYANDAIRLAAEMAKIYGAELTLLSVNQRLDSISDYVWNDSDLRSLLDRAANEAKVVGVANPNIVIVKGRDVGREIVVFAEQNNFDHVIVGTGGKGAVERLMLGSVSSDVVRRAHCPVTVAR